MLRSAKQLKIGWHQAAPSSPYASGWLTNAAWLFLPRQNRLGSAAVESAILAAFLVALIFILQGWTGFSLWDEGFLWYGVQRVSLGEVPIRDFMSYDPGRYYWAAALGHLWGDHGIVSVRLSITVMQWLGLTAGLYLLRRDGENDRLLWLFAALTLTVWMFPRHKIFDIGICLMLVLAMTLLVARPQAQRYFLAGFAVGMAAIFGRNHGVYGVVALAMILPFLCFFEQGRSWAIGFKSVGWTGIGIVAGYSPVLMMLVLVPGFDRAFLDSLLFHLEVKTTNLPLPVPWPWRVDIKHLSAFEAIRGILLGLAFLALMGFAIAAPFLVVLRRLSGRCLKPFHIATAALALPYAHYAFSRADAGHLAQGIFPALLGGLFLLGSVRQNIRWTYGFALCLVSLAIMLPRHQAWTCAGNNACESVKIGKDVLHVGRGTAAHVALLEDLKNKASATNRPVLALPFWPGANALLEQKAPIWSIYSLFPRNEAFQKAEIERIKAAAPRYAVLVDWPLDGHDALRFRNANPLIFNYIDNTFRRLPDVPRQPHLQLYEAP